MKKMKFYPNHVNPKIYNHHNQQTNQSTIHPNGPETVFIPGVFSLLCINTSIHTDWVRPVLLTEHCDDNDDEDGEDGEDDEDDDHDDEDGEDDENDEHDVDFSPPPPLRGRFR